ncbi:chemotaxis protein CheW [Comamonas testosteroni]|uniref:Chemotaxis protein CheW n=1 Tax=Comamonas testosteroni TaxID=285 RepID=A0A096FPI5_COMTE|nr:chemotaxis protein CheW [Comamonas testosteroni]KGH31854.1 chemotaxis protein CheW [Comamonas testosteroni]
MPLETMTAPAQRAQDLLQTDVFIPHMRQVGRCESSLRELNLMWRLIESSAKMNCPQEAQALLPMMAATRGGFERLEQDLVQSMVMQAVTGVTAGLASQAQHLIDTLVRNLYERTADVGFLATDAMLCQFMAGADGDEAAITQRLRAYRSKYTVYADILLLDAEGQVRASASERSQATGQPCRDALIARALQSQGFVQGFGITDLLPGHDSGLIYAHRMLHPINQQAVGVLCLCFDFDGEMQGIWSGRDRTDGSGAPEAQTSIALLLDEQGQVLASSDLHWIGVGANVRPHRDGASVLHVHGGRTYLVQSAASAGYQGYMGPQGWRAQIMTPLELAFGLQSQAGLEGLDAAVAQGLLTHAHRFCPPLHAIHSAADTIRRVVWNGRVMTAGKQMDNTRLQAVLEQIGETGARTNEVFSQSIDALYGTVLNTALRDNSLLTSLLVDLLDRNLYERANDCRWWALTPQLSELLEVLALGERAGDQVSEACELLTAIHDLYTVYQQIMVYDIRGKVVAISQRGRLDAGGSELLGTYIEADSLHQVLALAGTQAYHVSPWRPCVQHEDEGPTYVYHAAIRNSDGMVLGGIGLVFHAQREFKAMLEGVTGVQAGGAGSRRVAYLSRSGMVMSSSDVQLQPGVQLELPPVMLALAPGQSMARAMVYQGQYCVVAITAGSGYREFKRSDGYREEVLALSVQAFGAVQDDALAAVSRRNTRVQSLAAASQGSAAGMEMATFFVGRSVLAVDAACVLEAQSASAIAPVSAGRLPHCVGTLARRSQGAVAGYVWVFDLGALLFGKPVTRTAQSQVIVLEHLGLKLGVLVSDLEGVVRFESGQLRLAPAMAGAADQLVDRLIRANEGDLLIQCLNVAALVRMLKAPLPAEQGAGG